MLFFSFELLLLEVFFILLVYLLIINNSEYSQLFLSLVLLVLLNLFMFIHNCSLFGIVLFSVEVHVIYYIFCILLIFNRGEVSQINNLFSSNQLLSSRFLFLCVLCFGYVVLTGSNLKYFLGGCDQYVLMLIAARSSNLAAFAGNQATSLLTAFVEIYLLFNSFEFVVINFIMLIAVFIYYLLSRVMRYNSVIISTLGLRELNSFLNFNCKFLRYPHQGRQLMRVAAVMSKGNPNKFNY